MIVLVAATEREARPLIAALGAAECRLSPFATWSAEIPGPQRQIRLVVSGVGKVAAAAATAGLLAQKDVNWLINFGACGVLVDRSDLQAGTLCQAAGAVEGDHLGMGERPPGRVACRILEGAGLTPVNLVTVDQPVFDPERRAALTAFGQVVDMEGAAVARTATWFKVPCSLIKGISDPAGFGDRRQLRASLDRVAGALAGKVMEILHQPEISV